MALIMKINDRFRNRRVLYFNDFTFDLVFNSIASTFSFTFNFDPDNTEHVELACVSHFHEVTLEHIPTGQTKPIMVLKGMLIQQKFKQTAKPELTSFSGYSLPGQLGDCTIPNSLYPLQSNGASLATMAKRITDAFKLNLVIDPSVTDLVKGNYKSITASTTQGAKDFLNSMAKQKDIMLSHDEFGRLLLTKANIDKKPIFEFDLRQGTPEGFEFEFDYNGQGMHRNITVRKESGIDGGNAGQVSVVNPLVVGSITRPTSVTQSTGDENNTSLAARRARSNELRGIKLTIRCSKWNIGKELIKPNNTIKIIAPRLYLFRWEKFFIESVSFQGNHESLTCQINCVLPEVYSQDGKVVNIFRGLNLHPVEE
jgi:prophage tail gpP-like protein